MRKCAPFNLMSQDSTSAIFLEIKFFVSNLFFQEFQISKNMLVSAPNFKSLKKGVCCKLSELVEINDYTYNVSHFIFQLLATVYCINNI